MKLFRHLAGVFALSLLVSCFNVGGAPLWPVPLAGADSSDPVPDLPFCVASPTWSAGELGRSVLYRSERQGSTLTVGYFVYWTTERPWGKNALSYAVLPALLIDAFYSHLFFL